jgi:hypothetical protein
MREEKNMTSPMKNGSRAANQMFSTFPETTLTDFPES